MSDIKKEIVKALSNADDGLTIQNLIDITKRSRGSIKMNLLYLMLDNEVREIAYTKNSKVYKLNSDG